MVTMRGHINPSIAITKVAQKVRCMCSNEPLGNCSGVLKEHLIRHVLKGQNRGTHLFLKTINLLSIFTYMK